MKTVERSMRANIILIVRDKGPKVHVTVRVEAADGRNLMVEREDAEKEGNNLFLLMGRMMEVAMGEIMFPYMAEIQKELT